MILKNCLLNLGKDNMKTEDEEKDWVKVLYEVILKILTLGFYHIEKHKNK